MDPKITSEIWTNLDFDDVSPAGKLAAFWLITNHQVDVLGYADLSLRRFVFETKLKEQALAEGFKALGKGLVRVAKGYWLRNYIGIQFGRGPTLSRNNFTKGIIKRLNNGCDADLVRLVLEEYAELKEVKGLPTPCQGVAKGLLTASEGVAKGSDEVTNHKRGEERRGEEQRGEEQIGGAGGSEPASTLDEAIEHDAANGSPIVTAAGADQDLAPASSDSAATSTDDEAWALKIYGAYPRKEARATALRAIEKALEKNPNRYVALYAATLNYSDAVARWSPEDRAKYVPHAATWFNRESYLDDPTVWERPSAPAKNSTGVTSGAPIVRNPVIFKD